MINGQNHKGSTYHIGKMLADKLAEKIRITILRRIRIILIHHLIIIFA